MTKMIGKWRDTWKCALCGEEHTGWGSNPAPLMDYNSALVCPRCNEIVIQFRSLLRQMGYINNRMTITRRVYNEIKEYVVKHPEYKPFADYLDRYFKDTDIRKITDPNDYGDLVEKPDAAYESAVTSNLIAGLLAGDEVVSNIRVSKISA